MRSVFLRLTALAGAVALVASCDSRLPTATSVGNIPTSSTSSPTTAKPSIVIDSPLCGGPAKHAGDKFTLIGPQLQDQIERRTAFGERVVERAGLLERARKAIEQAAAGEVRLIELFPDHRQH